MPDLNNLIPLGALNIRTQIMPDEAKAILEIFAARKDQYGRTILPSEIDAMTVLALMEKGVIKNAAYPHKSMHTNIVEFTPEGKNLLEKIILSEPNRFELNKKSGKVAKKEETVNVKVASKQIKEKKNWLQKLF